MKTASFAGIAAFAFEGLCTSTDLIDDEFVTMTLEHWTADGKLYF